MQATESLFLLSQTDCIKKKTCRMHNWLFLDHFFILLQVLYFSFYRALPGFSCWNVWKRANFKSQKKMPVVLPQIRIQIFF